MDTTISAYHSADCPEVIRGVACSGGIGGAGAPHCAPGRTTHCALRTRAFPSAVVYASASHSAMHTPVDVTGFEPAKASLQNLGLPNLLSTHPTILFWLGNRRPSGGRTDALCRLECQRFSECTPRAAIRVSVITSWEAAYPPWQHVRRCQCCSYRQLWQHAHSLRAAQRWDCQPERLQRRDDTHPRTYRRKAPRVYSPPLRPI